MPEPEDRERAVMLNPRDAQQRVRIGRAAAPAGWGGLVDYLWWVRWATPEPFVQGVIARPVVHVTAELVEGRPALVVTGPTTRRFERRLVAAGQTVAVAFRPGGFRPVLGEDVARLRDRELPLSEVLAQAPSVEAALAEEALATAAAGEEEAGARLVLRALAPEPPAPDPLAVEIAGLVEEVERDSSVVRAEQVADRAGVTLRTLQRRFVSYVGVGPKWVVQRCRLLDVAEAAHGGREVDWAGLASRLGYTDQSHLIRHFRAVVGEPPARYRRGT